MATMATERRTAEQVYGLQRDRDMAWSRVAGAGDPNAMTCAERAYQQTLVAELEVLENELREARSEIGGRVYRVPDENLHGLEQRVARINRRAAKLDVEPVHFVVTSETWELTRTSETTGEVIEVVPHAFVVVGSQVVKLAGWRFAATIEHDEGNWRVAGAAGRSRCRASAGRMAATGRCSPRSVKTIRCGSCRASSC